MGELSGELSLSMVPCPLAEERRQLLTRRASRSTQATTTALCLGELNDKIVSAALASTLHIITFFNSSWLCPQEVLQGNRPLTLSDELLPVHRSCCDRPSMARQLKQTKLPTGGVTTISAPHQGETD